MSAIHPIVPHAHLAREKGIAHLALARSAYLVALGLILHAVTVGRLAIQ